MHNLLIVFTTLIVMFANLAFSFPDKSFNLNIAIKDAMPFVENNADVPFGTYLVRNLPLAPMQDLKTSLEASIEQTLISRNEAHITVITPPEYDNIKAIVSMDEIHEIVRDAMQNTSFDPICVGKGSVAIAGNIESTYFVVVASDDLFEIRGQIAELVYSRHGSFSLFSAEKYWPHITIGFTKRDLHFQDGIIKDQSSCFANVNMID